MVYEAGVVESFTRRAIEHLASARPTQRQANALLLGHIVYRSREAVAGPVDALLGLLEPAAKADVETRRNAVRSLADVAVQSVAEELIRECLLPHLSDVEVEPDYSRCAELRPRGGGPDEGVRRLHDRPAR